MRGKLITTAILSVMVSSVVAAGALFENGDFEVGTLKNWTAEGEAFERGPTSGAVVSKWDTTGSVGKGLRDNWKNKPELYRQPELGGFEGKGFANSYHPEKLDKATGTLTSKSFVIRDDYICFLLASGKDPQAGALAVNLVMDGRIVRQAVPKGEEFVRCCFDVRQIRGKQARIEIVDQAILHGGWIAADSIKGEDKPSSDWVVREADRIVRRVSAARKFNCNKRYLNIGAVGAFPEDAVKLIVDGRVVQEICMAVADGEPAEFWQFIDLSLWHGKEATLKMDGWSWSDEPLSGVFLDDRMRGLNNLYNEKYRPQFHCTPIQGWNNDINGAVYYDGEYHVFYQYDPSRSGAGGRNMHWGHAVSADLFHWVHLPIALGVDPIRGQNYSGSAVVDFDNSAGFQKGDEKTLVAFYTRRKPMTFVKWDYDVERSDQCIAYSTDRGRTWTHVEKPAVAGITAKNRDPKVFWHQASGKWIMAFFIRDGYSFYSSKNLRDWKKESHISGFHECPDIFELEVDGDPKNSRWLLVNGNGSYHIGSFDGREFTTETQARGAFGPLSATQTFNHAPDDGRRRVQMNWFHIFPRKRMIELGMPFSQLLSLPVELTLRTTDEGIRMFSNPAREIASIRAQRRGYPMKDLSVGPLEVSDIPWELYEVVVTFDFENANTIGVRIRGIEISYDVKTQMLSLGNYKAKVKPQNGKLKLRVLLDRCFADLFANDGRVYLMDSAYPDNSRAALECYAEGGKVTAENIEFYRLKSIWKND